MLNVGRVLPYIPKSSNDLVAFWYDMFLPQILGIYRSELDLSIYNKFNNRLGDFLESEKNFNTIGFYSLETVNIKI